MGAERMQSLAELSREWGLPEPDLELLSEVAVERIAALRAERDWLRHAIRRHHHDVLNAEDEADRIEAERRLWASNSHATLAALDAKEGT